MHNNIMSEVIRLPILKNELLRSIFGSMTTYSSDRDVESSRSTTQGNLYERSGPPRAGLSYTATLELGPSRRSRMRPIATAVHSCYSEPDDVTQLPYATKLRTLEDVALGKICIRAALLSAIYGSYLAT